MSTSRVWLSNNREGILAMIRDWQSVAGTSASAWGIPPNVLQELGSLIQAADTALATVKNETTTTASGTPSAQVTIETYLVGRHELGIKIIYVTGSPAGPANKGFRIWYSIVTPGETPPTNPDELRKSFFTKRKKDMIEFEFGDLGKNCFMAVQIKNDGKKGNWGSLTSTLIP